MGVGPGVKTVAAVLGAMGQRVGLWVCEMEGGAWDGGGGALGWKVRAGMGSLGRG